MQTVIVSGGNGFIGSSLIARLLADGVDVHAIVNENHQRLDAILPPENIHELEEGPGSSVEIVTRLQPDTIFHLAAVYAEPVSARCVLSMIEGNLTLGASLLFAGSKCARRPVFVNTGTYWQFDENAEYSPNTLYAATKQAFQDILFFYRTRFGIESVSLILYDTFGEHDTRPKLWRRLTSSKPGTPIDLSEGSQTIHLVHIDDTVDAFLRAAELLHSGAPLEPIYSVPSSRPHTLRSLVEELNERGRLGLELRWGTLPYWEGQVMEPWVGPPVPGWAPKVDILPVLLRMADTHSDNTSATPTDSPELISERE